ncbi:hypothetical protein B0A50_00455 [Salinomyces thailandicus]|uniref:C3H1-type domain-containing protein n=1 Tax=Salinomyces thailandicus TaxID=706561 RepID=A0A4V5N6R7_9PEZI|nr:hypothetical protein B0A50_00455 [Salinomyces thailandica]
MRSIEALPRKTAKEYRESSEIMVMVQSGVLEEVVVAVRLMEASGLLEEVLAMAREQKPSASSSSVWTRKATKPHYRELQRAHAISTSSPSMPPKKGDKSQNAPKKKTATVEDKTFGMKNKKGGAAQKQIKQISQAQAASGTPEQKKKEAEKMQKEKEKLAAEQARREAAELFKPAQTQKVPFGVDPKTILCQFYKKGACEKGKKCKFSHDLNIERKGEKKSLYTDTREGDQEEDQEQDVKKKDDMADWDEEKLRSVVMSKHGNPKTTTDKVCKFFIEAVENQKYGWFWTCPNGGDKCMYKHSLPPGFVLKTKEQRAAEKALMDKSPLATLTLEDFLESERFKLQGNLTPVTEESFSEWKRKRQDKKEAEEQAKKMKEATGRAMFEQGDWEASSDEDEDDDDDSWNLEALRRETEAARQKKEEERLGVAGGAGEMVEVAGEPNGNVGD